MLRKNDTRIIFTNDNVIVLRVVDDAHSKYRVFIDGIDKGYLLKSDGIFIPEPQTEISLKIILKLNELANKSEAA